ncbi:aarF domain-containing protein kinase 1-like [Carassius carassius]|uniref:aarF domain-containing protein kinase 1-like n=1 Tax=Carassius carassius TaxID=217509 RepID=UPI002868C044|nr:aarF domain-containing protein kinase 1-like [Carassius carassius]XP_059374713.1 aarF domain-containing protein kinase 1-like [Carassius carassius]
MNVVQYIPQISELLNRIPRQMLLLLKTNDLLRGIETILQTRASSSSFINMSRCCTHAIARLAFFKVEGLQGHASQKTPHFPQPEGNSQQS